MTPQLIGLSGGSCSGKTTLARAMLEVHGGDATLLMFDAYSHALSHLPPDARAKVNFDHPDSLDVDLFCKHLRDLAAGRGVDVPHYDFATHTRPGTSHRVEPARYVLVDGILLLALTECREALDLRVFVDAPAAVRLERRIERDVAERGRDEDGVRRQFAETVSPMHDDFVAPSEAYADLAFHHPFEVADAEARLQPYLQS